MHPRSVPQSGPRSQQARPAPVRVGAGSAPVVDDVRTDPFGIPAQARALSPAEAIPAQRAPVDPATPARPAPAAPGRRRWLWAVLVAVVLAGAAYGGWSLLHGRGAVTAGAPVARAQVGVAAESASGLTFTISAPRPYQPSNPLLLDKGDTAYEATMTILNDSGDVAQASKVAVAATVGGRPAAQIFDQTFLATQQIAVGQQLQVPFRFRVAAGATGPVEITVTESGVPTVIVAGAL